MVEDGEPILAERLKFPNIWISNTPQKQEQMKLITKLMLMLATAAVATAALATSTIPAEPVPNTIPQAVEWNQQCAARVAAFNGKPCDVIFIGDSITQNFIDSPHGGWNLVGHGVWEKYYGHRAVLNFGVGGDSTQNALWRMEHMDIAGLRPKVAVVMLGMNNQNDTPEDIARGVKAVIDKARDMFPGVKVVVMSVTANGRMPGKTPQINTLLTAFADGRDVFYVDLYSQMPSTSPNSWQGVGGDKVHLTKEGYEIWASTLEPVLIKLGVPPAIQHSP